MLFQQWDQAENAQRSLEILRDLALPIAKDGGPVGHQIHDLIARGDWPALLDFELDYSSDLLSAHQLMRCRQALGFFTKFPGLPLGRNVEKVAYDKFIGTEAACKFTNSLFRGIVRGSATCRPRDAKVAYLARRKMRRLLGRCPTIGELQGYFGPGATTSIKRLDSCVQTKFAAGLQCSSNFHACGLLPAAIDSLPHWAGALSEDWFVDDGGWLTHRVPVDLVDGRLEFVPKTAKENRSIVVEPSLNGFFQNGAGAAISDRLSCAGIKVNTRDQSRNRELALRGSLDGTLATIDLSSASDTIAYEVVKFLLPEAWFNLLNALRTPSVSYKGRVIHLEKFSSMGNGFTFPLETAIFWCITTAAVEIQNGHVDYEDVSAYGDDLICPTSAYNAVTRALEFFGFQVNPAKSFASGHFRESCGHDYFKGINIRPYYQKHLVSGLTLFTMHNFFVRSGDLDMAKRVRAHIPRHLRLYGPDGYGDGHLVSDEWPRIPPSRRAAAKGYSGVSFETLTLGPRRQTSRYPGDYVSPLYSIYRSASRGPLDDERAPIEFTRDGRPTWSLPGSNGVKRVKIYTLG